jgi:CHAD domain-containing protein
VRRIAREQIDKALEHIDAPSEPPTAVHGVRRRCKQLRGLLRLVRDGLGRAYRRENRAFRDTAKRLGRLRDQRVVLATHDGLLGEFDAAIARSGALRVRERLAQLTTSRQQVPAAEIAGALHAAHEELTIATQRIQDWRVSGDSGHVMRKGLERTYKRARKGLVRARRTLDVTDFHEWRKRVKYHWFHLRLVRAKCPEVMSRANEVEGLGALLGEAHDLAVYESRLGKIVDSGYRDMLALLRSLSAGRRAALERRALDKGAALFRERPRDFVRTLNLSD